MVAAMGLCDNESKQREQTLQVADPRPTTYQARLSDVLIGASSRLGCFTFCLIKSIESEPLIVGHARRETSINGRT